MGGLVLDANIVRDFDVEWADIVLKLPQRDGRLYFHTTDFVTGADIYKKDWAGRLEEKREVLASLCRVMDKYGLQFLTSVIDMDDYAKVDNVIKLSEVAGHPYALGCRIAKEQVRQWAYSQNIQSPVKMVVEDRKGFMGEVVKSFEKDLLPPPSIEDKSTPALQAADVIAWFRFRKKHPTHPYEQVKAAWGEVPKYLIQDNTFGINEVLGMLTNIMREHGGLPIPLRKDKDHNVYYSTEPKQKRLPLKRPRRKPSVKLL
jgi:hypothetical protein